MEFIQGGMDFDCNNQDINLNPYNKTTQKYKYQEWRDGWLTTQLWYWETLSANDNEEYIE